MGKIPPATLVARDELPPASKALLKQSGTLARYDAFEKTLLHVPLHSGKVEDTFTDFAAGSELSNRGKVAALVVAYALGASIWVASLMFGEQMLNILSGH